jgi:hypothetical protein
MKLSLILPVYKSKQYLEKNLPIIYDYLKCLSLHFEIIVAEDGSSDVFTEKIISFIKRHKEISFIHSKNRLGRGRAIKKSVQKLSGDIIGYMDIDLATYIDNLKKVVYLFEKKDYDVVIGSRYLSESYSKRSRTRLIASLIFNFLLKILFKSQIKDHQCGFKFFEKKFIKKYANKAKNDYWFWDTEILIIAQMKRKRIYELSVKWREAKMSTVKIFQDSINMFMNVVNLFLKIHFK